MSLHHWPDPEWAREQEHRICRAREEAFARGLVFGALCGAVSALIALAIVAAAGGLR